MQLFRHHRLIDTERCLIGHAMISEHQFSRCFIQIILVIFIRLTHVCSTLKTSRGKSGINVGFARTLSYNRVRVVMVRYC